MKLTVLATVIGAMFVSQTSFAHCMHEKYYVGGGVAINSAGNYSETNGYQFLGGYCLDFNFKSPKSKTSVELGYMSSGNFEREYQVAPNNPNRPVRSVTEQDSYQGLWFSGLAEYKFDPKIHVMGRVGLDMGDDNGIFIGAGIGFNLTRWAQIRAEYIEKSAVTSMQLNWISEF